MGDERKGGLVILSHLNVANYLVAVSNTFLRWKLQWRSMWLLRKNMGLLRCWQLVWTFEPLLSNWVGLKYV